MKIRKPVVAGRFYPEKKEEIISQLKMIREKELPDIKLSLKNRNVIGGVVPHAGYMFSAYQAVHFFEIISQSDYQYDTIVIINPNHTGLGNKVAFDAHDAWETPLGSTLLDVEFGQALGISISETEQLREHSGEVMLPLLQYFLKYNFKIAPITLSNQSFNQTQILAKKIYRAVQDLKRNILVVASSDFSHFLSPEKGMEMDEYVLKNILALNSQGVEKEVLDKRISVCGYGPIMTLIEYAKLVNKNPQVDVLKRGHSGEIIPSNEVVDYISILFS